MEKVRILIVEDGLIIAESLKIMLEGMGYKVPATFVSGKETREHFKQGFASIIIDWVKKIQENRLWIEDQEIPVGENLSKRDP